MFTSLQRREALQLYDALGSIERVIAILGYPSVQCLRNWINKRGQPKKPRKPRVFLDDEDKLVAVMRLESGEGALSISADIGVADSTIHNWRRALRGGGGRVRKKSKPKAGVAHDEFPDDVDELKRMCQNLKMENELMRRTVDVVKKDPGVDLRMLSNREKTALIDAMRLTYSLSCLAKRLESSLSSYHYNHAAMGRRDKDDKARSAIVEEFEAVGGSRGYRYIHRRLAERGTRAGEKKARRLMAEEGCMVVYARKPKIRYSSYEGEISPALPNIPFKEDGTHNFSEGAPNRLWLTDITEFKLPDDDRKVYLSPILDCFDGRLASWSIGTRPTADLANASLDAACKSLEEGEHPVCHSDRGAHYRWQGWIELCDRHGLIRSMSRKATSPDNAAMEGFFGMLKQEFFYRRDWSGVSAEDFIDRLNTWLGYYNKERIRESPGWLSLNRYRRSLGLAA